LLKLCSRGSSHRDARVGAQLTAIVRFARLCGRRCVPMAIRDRRIGVRLELMAPHLARRHRRG
jgi:hypothetical protein